MEVKDLDTYQDLGLNACRICYRSPSSWVFATTSRPYLTQIIPPEIRRMIISYGVLGAGGSQPIKADIISKRVEFFEGDETALSSEPVRPNPTREAHFTFVALSLSCRLLNEESTSLFFSKNRFSFHDVLGMRIFLDGITYVQRSQMTHIIFVRSPHDSNFDLHWASDLLSQCNIKKLTIGIPSDMIEAFNGYVGFLVHAMELDFVRDVRGWENFQVKVVVAEQWIVEDLDWKPASLITVSSTGKQRRVAEKLKIWEQSLQEEMEKREPPELSNFERRENKYEESMRPCVRQQGWEKYCIAGSQWDRIGGMDICEVCFIAWMESKKESCIKLTRNTSSKSDGESAQAQ